MPPPIQPVPRYSADAGDGTTLHTFRLSESGLDILLELYSHAAAPSSTPTYYSDTNVSGTVEIAFTKSQTIQAVILEVRGARRGIREFGGLSNDIDKPFLELPTTLFESSKTAKLRVGTHRLPFSVRLPRPGETPPAGQHSRELPLPPTLGSRGLHEYIIYSVKCTVKRGMFSSDQDITTQFRYVPRKTAAAPSSLRAIAYQERSPILGPALDPDGWVTRSVELTGRLFGDRDVSVTCRLSVAAPLEFPRGFPIPFQLELESSDEQALDVIAQFTGLQIVLERHMRVVSAQMRGEVPDPVGFGRYWSSVATQPPGRRMLEGEIPVLRQVMQSYGYSQATLSYSIRLTSQVAGLVVSQPGAPIDIPIEITYLPAPGPQPVTYAPPMRHGEQAPMKEIGFSTNMPLRGLVQDRDI